MIVSGLQAAINNREKTENLFPGNRRRQTQLHPLFEGLEKALELEIHSDIKAYYNRYWSDPIPARFEDGDLSLLFVWNDEDFERLRGNLIGHAMAKHKIKAATDIFFRLYGTGRAGTESGKPEWSNFAGKTRQTSA